MRSQPTPVDPAVLGANHTLFLHPRQFSNIFHVLEGTSAVLRCAIHPELFPRVDQIIISKLPRGTPDSWTAELLSLYLDTFPAGRRPSYLFPRKRGEKVCDRGMVVAKAWETRGTGSFIGEPLAADLLRAAAYRKFGWAFHGKGKGEKVEGILIKRLGKRKLLNHDEVLKSLQNEFGSELNLREVSVEQYSGREQIELFMNIDIVVAAHGAALTNIIWMVPQSFVYELFPPEWRFGCYQRLADNEGLQYRKDMAKGELGRECQVSPKSISCMYAGTRDRDFTMEVGVVKEGVKMAVERVRLNKYQIVCAVCFSKRKTVSHFLKLDMCWILLCCLAFIVTLCDENDHHVGARKAIYE